MGSRAIAELWRRQDDNSTEHGNGNGASGLDGTTHGDEINDYYDGYDNAWWWSPTGMTVRYTIVCVVFAMLLVFLVAGYIHARRRVRKGLPPLPYHRWMVHRNARYQQAAYHPYNQQDPYQEGYTMHGYAPPPPAYRRDAPPAYMPPEGGSKVMADQHYHAAPAGDGGEDSAGQTFASGARQ